MRAWQMINRVQIVLFIMLIFPFTGFCAEQQTIRIGLNLALTGKYAFLGKDAKEGLDLYKEQINRAGGIKVGDSSYLLEYIPIDNESDEGTAVQVALKLITQENVLGIIGPSASSQAIPSGAIANSFHTPMISSTSTNPKTTIDRPFVFRACLLDSFQGKVMAEFAIKKFGAKKAAILFNAASAYPRGLAGFFKQSFEDQQGAGSVVAYEDYLSSEKDLSAHFDNIVGSNADILFVPQYANEITSLVKQARSRGWDKVILGGSAWHSEQLTKECGKQCEDLYFTSHFSSTGSKLKTKDFVKQFKQKYGKIPSSFSALAYDAGELLVTAISNLSALNENLLTTRKNIKTALAKVRGFEGVTGNLDMNINGDPAKSVVIIRIDQNGKFESYQTVSP